MFQNTISIHPWLNFPQITQKCDLAEVIMEFCKRESANIKERHFVYCFQNSV